MCKIVIRGKNGIPRIFGKKSSYLQKYAIDLDETKSILLLKKYSLRIFIWILKFRFENSQEWINHDRYQVLWDALYKNGWRLYYGNFWLRIPHCTFIFSAFLVLVFQLYLVNDQISLEIPIKANMKTFLLPRIWIDDCHVTISSNSYTIPRHFIELREEINMAIRMIMSREEVTPSHKYSAHTSLLSRGTN